MAQQADMLMVMRAKDELTKPLARAQEQLGKTAKAGKDLNGTFRLMRGGAGQLGHQIQDIAVQAQMGTSAFIIFGQQGSQIASLFGPGGALFGAFLAIAAAAAGPLMTAMTGSTGALEELKDKAIGAEPVLARLTGSLREQAKLMVRANLKQLLVEQAIATEDLGKAQKDLDQALRVQKVFGNTFGVAENVESARKAVGDLESQVQAGSQEIERLKDNFRGLDPEITKTNQSLREEIAVFDKSASAVAQYKAELDGVVTVQEKEQIELLGVIEHLEESKKAREDDAKAAIKAAEEIKRALAVEEKKDVAAGKAFTSMVEGMFGPEERIEVEMEKRLGIVDEALARGQINLITAENMRTVIEQEASKKRIKNAEDEEKLKNDQRKKAIAGVGDQLMALDASNKKVFMMQKAYKIVQATMDARTAFSNALAAPFPPPIPQMLAGAALAMGMANVATIKSQSFEGGGFTGFGARAGGLDGKGGRMAMVHPNESIIDHTKGGASGITVINNVDARGSGADVDQKIKSAMAQTSQQTIMTIQDLMRRRRFA